MYCAYPIPKEIAASGSYIWVRTAHPEDFDFDNQNPDMDTSTFVELAVFWLHWNITRVLSLLGCQGKILSFFRKKLLNQFIIHIQTERRNRLY